MWKTRIKDMPEGFPGGSVVKNLLASAGDAGVIPAMGRSYGEGNGTPFQYSCLGNPMDRSLVDNSPWDHKDSKHNCMTHTFTLFLSETIKVSKWKKMRTGNIKVNKRNRKP